MKDFFETLAIILLLGLGVWIAIQTVQPPMNEGGQTRPVMHPSWDADQDGYNDCEKEGICDDRVNYAQPRVQTEVAPEDGA